MSVIESDARAAATAARRKMMTTEAGRGPGPVWRRLLALLAAATALAGVAEVGGGARGQWTVTNLHPAGASSSHALGVSGGQQVGDVTIDSALHASLWRGTAASWVDLHPAGAASSQARAVDGGQQVGSASIGGPSHAGVWSGTAASWVDLNPVGSFVGIAYGVHAGQQGGFIDQRAFVWNGTAASRVSLHPAGASDSYVFAVHDGQQAGQTVIAGQSHACTWSGTAA